MAIRIKVNAAGAVNALGRFAASTSAGQRVELMRTIGAGMLVSIYKTFQEEGSPSGSWPGLAASTIKRMKGAGGHKLLFQRGRLRNSIHSVAEANRVVIGTNLVYAAVHLYGSRDRGIGEGPQAKIDGRGVLVKGRDSHRTATRGKGGLRIVDKNGVSRMVTRNMAGPLMRTYFKVKGHTRHQNIPARPYLVFRPEDPARIREQVDLFYLTQARNAGLQVR